MKFSNIIAFAGLACAAVPKVPIVERKVALLEERQTSVFQTLLDSINTIGDGIDDSLGAVSTSVTAVLNAGLIVPPALVNTLKGAIDDLADEIESGTGDLTTIVDGITEDLANNVITLTQAQITLLTNAVAATRNIIENIDVVVEEDIADLSILIILAIGQQLLALESVLAPFVAPIDELVEGVIDNASSISLVVTGLQNAVDQLNNQLNALLDFIGIGLLFRKN